MSAVPVPVPPARRFVPAAVEVTERRGATVVIDRQPNLCRWAIHALTPAGKPVVVTGPRRGEKTNPSNRELAAQITAGVRATGVEVTQVFAADWVTANLLKEKSALPVSDLAAPPAALAAAREGITAVEKRMVTGLTLACDSSRRKGHSVNGCGWVLAYTTGADPLVGTYTTVSENGGIRAGELAAIRRGLQATLNLHPTLRDGIGDLTVLTDSKAALELLEKVRNGESTVWEDADSVSECRRILGSARDGNIRFEWVRGHNGHTMNEFADRLAVLARRNEEMGVDELTHARMVAGIREDAKLALTEA